MKESKKQTDLFFDNNVNGLCIIDKYFRCIKVNSAYMRFIEENGKMRDLNKNQIWEPFGRESIEKIFSGDLEEIEIKKEYGVQLYSLHANPVLDYEKRILNILITLTDITDYQMMTENALFAEKMSGVGMIASGIAHDMKSVFSILGNSNMAIKSISEGIQNKDLREKIQRMLQTQEHGLQNGRKLLTQILSYSGQVKEVVEDFSLKESVEKIIRIFNGEILGKNASVIVEIRDKIFIESVSSKFSQIFMNLLANALDAIEQNGTIIVSEDSRNAFLSLSFKDDGRGIQNEDKEQVFQAFFTTKDKGIGLGLFTVKNIVEELGGRITVSSKTDGGTKFLITIKNNEKFKIRV